MKKKFFAFVASLVLVAAVGTGATLAYLTDSTQTVTNTFAVGKVDISIDETVESPFVVKKDAEGLTTGADFVKLLPGTTYAKNPVVTVDKESESCYVFIKVNNTTQGKVSIVDFNTEWIPYSINEEVVAYYQIVDMSGVTEDVALGVFTKVKVDENVEENVNNTLGDITIVAAAVQYANVNGVDEAYSLISGKLN